MNDAIKARAVELLTGATADRVAVARFAWLCDGRDSITAALIVARDEIAPTSMRSRCGARFDATSFKRAKREIAAMGIVFAEAVPPPPRNLMERFYGGCPVMCGCTTLCRASPYFIPGRDDDNARPPRHH
jgi:hypothetical protein